MLPPPILIEQPNFLTWKLSGDCATGAWVALPATVPALQHLPSLREVGLPPWRLARGRRRSVPLCVLVYFAHAVCCCALYAASCSAHLLCSPLLRPPGHYPYAPRFSPCNSSLAGGSAPTQACGFWGGGGCSLCVQVQTVKEVGWICSVHWGLTPVSTPLSPPSPARR